MSVTSLLELHCSVRKFWEYEQYAGAGPTQGFYYQYRHSRKPPIPIDFKSWKCSRQLHCIFPCRVVVHLPSPGCQQCPRYYNATLWGEGREAQVTVSRDNIMSLLGAAHCSWIVWSPRAFQSADKTERVQNPWVTQTLKYSTELLQLYGGAALIEKYIPADFIRKEREQFCLHSFLTIILSGCI